MSLFATRLSVERPLEGFRAGAQPSSGGRSKAVGRTLAIRKEGDFGTPTPRLWYAYIETLVRKQRDFGTQTTRLWYANNETLIRKHRDFDTQTPRLWQIFIGTKRKKWLFSCVQPVFFLPLSRNSIKRYKHKETLRNDVPSLADASCPVCLPSCAAAPLPCRGGAGVGSVLFYAKKILTPPPTPPLQG